MKTKILSQIKNQAGNSYYGIAVIAFICFVFLQSANADKINSEVYSETYSSPLSNNPINFQRLSLEVPSLLIEVPKSHLAVKPFISFENYDDQTITNSTFSLGLKSKLFESLTLEVAIRREGLFQVESSRWNFRTGLVYGGYWEFSKNIHADVYAEIYYAFPEFIDSYFTQAASAQVGYRYFENEKFSFDPITLGVRNSDNSNNAIAGADFITIHIGPQATFSFKQPQASITLNVSKSNSYSRSGTIINQYWLLLAMGVNF